MKEFGSFDYTKEKLFEMEQQISKEIDRLGGNSHLTAILQQLSIDNLV
jgi:hypothetical protein